MITIRKSLLSLAVASIVATPLIASAEGFGTVSANVALTTDYYFRGISQSDNDGAIQGGFDWSHDSGVYAGVWASNVAFGDTNLEFDTYAGFANEVGDFGYDIGVIKYNYNDTSSHDDPVEWYLNGSYSYFSAGFAYSPSWFGSHDSSKYIHLGFDYDELPMGLALSASVGKSFGDAYEVKGGRDYDYVDYKIGLNKDFYGLNWDVSYVGNDLSNKECDAYGYAASKGNCDDRFVLTISKSIDDVSKSSEGSDLPITANVSLVTDYYFRGISQSDNDGALQGGFDYSHDSGAYIGVWASNVAFGDTNLEFDTYAGFANDIGDFSYDVGVIKYNYNDTSSHDDPVEWYLNGSYSYFSAGFAYSPSWFGSHDSSKYVHAGFDYDEMPMGLALSASVGKSFGDAYEVKGGRDFDYVDYKLGVNRDFGGINVDVSYVGNDLSNKECDAYGYAASKGNCDDRFVLSFSKGF
ncbi:TorF family putative porin [sulfur-oxidizing endosymbiont of Gigantopelta aegis]|uniref:TorF family putative porin n=1 Tax=sulfur-oxidizing endosymbiont of Gigantopelta aegis TaxID=2794934 RepID=UPI0018DD66F7|nr:TorF family putative porin [sulfur-oxidizing endosymbiont of Gigantopelta aegis]